MLLAWKPLLEDSWMTLVLPARFSTVIFLAGMFLEDRVSRHIGGTGMSSTPARRGLSDLLARTLRGRPPSQGTWSPNR